MSLLSLESSKIVIVAKVKQESLHEDDEVLYLPLVLYPKTNNTVQEMTARVYEGLLRCSVPDGAVVRGLSLKGITAYSATRDQRVTLRTDEKRQVSTVLRHGVKEIHRDEEKYPRVVEDCQKLMLR